MRASEDICRESTNKDNNTISNKPVLPPPDDLLSLTAGAEDAAIDEETGATEDAATELATDANEDELSED